MLFFARDGKKKRGRQVAGPQRRGRRNLLMEPLEERQLLAVTAVADSETILGDAGPVAVEVLANDIDTNDTRVQSISAANFEVDGSSAWSVSETGTSPNNLTTTTTNTGDVQIQLDGAAIPYDSGVVLATARESLTSEFRVIESYAGASGAETWLSVQKQSANSEADVNVGVAYFPFADGWIAGNVAPSGVLQSGSGVSASDVSMKADGRYKLHIPGVSDSRTDGYLFAIGGSNEDNFASSEALGGDTWEVSVRDNTSNLSGGEQDDWSFLYLPRNAPNLVAGRINAAYAVDNPLYDGVGDFTLTKDATGVWRLNVAGANPTQGMLLLNNSVTGSTAPEDNFFSYQADGDDFVIEVRDQPGGELEDADFQFAFIPFDDAVMATPRPTSTLSVASVDAVTSPSGIPLSINADNTISVDTSGLVEGLIDSDSALTETFSYTVSDGTNTDTALATLTIVPVSDVPTVTERIPTQAFGENETGSVDLSAIFAHGESTLTYSASESDHVEVSFNGDTMELASKNDFFGYETVTVTATDVNGASASTTFFVNILPDASDTDGAIAAADSAETVTLRSVDIELLSNDYHPNGVAYDVAAANIDVPVDAGSNGESVWTVAQTGAAPNDMVVTSGGNVGDVAVALGSGPLYRSGGVLLGTLRNNSDPYGTVDPYPAWSTYGFATERGAGGNGERSMPVAAAYFPFADGWIGGQVTAAGQLTDGVGVAPTDITKIQNGFFTIELADVTDAAADGFLFGACVNNDDNAYSVRPIAGTNMWQYRQTDNDGDSFENDNWSFVYVPADTPNLIAGRFDAANEGSLVQTVQTGGTYTLTKEATGTYRLSIAGATPTDGALMLLGTGTGQADVGGIDTDVPDNVVTSYVADGNDFLIYTRQTVDFALVDAEFQFVYTPFDNPLTFNDGVDFSLTAFDATSAKGATITDNGDGTFNYDPTGSAELQALAYGTSTTDTFTYTLTDGHGTQTVGTATITVLAPEVEAADDNFWLAGDGLLNVTANDTFGPLPGPQVSALNVAINYDNVNQGSNQADSYIPVDSSGNPQRSTMPGSVTINESQDNWGDIDLYIDSDGGTNAEDGSDRVRMNRSHGVVIASLNENRDAIMGQGGYATLEVASESGDMWIATAQAPFPAIDVAGTDEEAIGVSAAFFSYSEGWIGGHVAPDGALVTSNGSPVVTQTATGIWEVQIPGVTDSYQQGFLFTVGASNEANVTQSRPIGGDTWEVILHDNSFTTTGQPNGEGNDWAFVYVPASATDLIGGTVVGASNSVNPMKQSIGDFTIQRQAEGEWLLSIPDQSPESGMLILEGQTISSAQPEHIYLSYEAAENGTDFVIHQHGLPDPNVRTDFDFQFLFVPFDNRVAQDPAQLPVVVDQVGTAAAPTSGVSELGIPLTINADNTITYDTGGALKELAEGQTATDTFVYQATLSTGGTSDTATVTVTHVGTNDAPEVVGSLPDQVFNEDDPMVSLDLTPLFDDVDVGDSFTYSFGNPNPDLVSLAINGTNLEVTPMANAFGFTQVSVTATDTGGASASTGLNITVLPTLDDDTPTAADDSVQTLVSETLTIDALGNDVHPDGALHDAAAATIDVPGGADNAGSTWTVVGTGTSPNALTILSEPNAADVAIGLNGNTLQVSDGVLLGTSRDNVSPYSSVQQWYWGTYNSLAFGTQTAFQGGSAERSGSLGAVYFPFADGWTSGRVGRFGDLQEGVGVSPAEITRTALGQYEVTVPGVTNAATEGYLFAIGTTNNFDITPSTQAQTSTDTWIVRQTYNDDGLTVDNDFAFVYLPNDTANLIAGRVATDGTLDTTLQAGSPTVVHESTGTYRITLPGGLTPADGTLLLTESGGSPVALSYTASDTDFVVEARAIPDFTLADAQFDFVFAPFETPLSPNPAAALTVTAFDATSTQGATVALNADGTFAYDPTGLTVSPGTAVTDTFTYTVEDGNGNSSTATVSVRVSSPGPNVADDSFSLAVDSSALNVLANDTFGEEPLQEPTQTVTSVNFEYVPGSEVQASNDADWIVPLDQNGIEQRSHVPGAVTFDGTQQNWGDVDLYIDVNGDGSNLQHMTGADGVVIPTITQNRSAILDTGGYASAEVHTEGGGNMWIATAAVDAGDEEAVYVSAAYFPFSEGWIGGHFDEGAGALAVVNGDPINGDPTVAANGSGRWIVTIPGVTDSTTEGMLFVVGGSNEDNFASALPLGGDSWEVALRDNAAATSGGENDDWSFVYIPRNATGLIGGQVIGDANVANAMRQSVGDFTIQRQDAGEWVLSIPGHSPETGMLILQSSDPDSTTAEHVLFSYDAAENGTDFVIHQHQLPTPDTRTDLDFNFLFVPFANMISQTGPLAVDQLGTAATPDSNLSEQGAALSINADGTVQYAADSLVAPLGEGETVTDTFVYRATDGANSASGVVNVTLVGVNDAPQLVGSLDDQMFDEDGAPLTLSLASLFNEIDNNDSFTLSIGNNRTDLVDAQLTGQDNLELLLTPQPNAFGGPATITVTATDTAGAETSTTFQVTVFSQEDGPQAVADSGETDTGTSITISVLGNDYHPDDGPLDVLAANVYADSTATDNAGSVWTIEQTGPAPYNMTVQSGGNLGDVAIGVDGQDLYPTDGVLLGTIRENVAPYGTVNSYQAFSSYGFATDTGVGDGERNSPLGAALFPFADGWTGGHVLADGSLAYGVDVAPSNITKLGTGLYQIDVPGVTDSYTEGFLFAIGGANDDNAYSAAPIGGNSWQFRQLDNDADGTGFEDDSWSFVYLPADTPGLVAGRWDAFGGEGMGAVAQQVGNFTLQTAGMGGEGAGGEYRLSIDGMSPTDGVLLLISTGTEFVADVGVVPDNRVLSYVADTGTSDFLIFGRQTQDFMIPNTSFAFAFIPFATPLKAGDYLDYSIVSFDATSAAGATVASNGDGTFDYDPSSSATLQALEPGQSVEDTFTYTIQDGNGVQSMATVTVIVEAEGTPIDFGDAPDSVDTPGYPTLLVNDGARHDAVGPTLGATRDMEADGQPTAAADGDDTNGTASDEDGIADVSVIAPGYRDAYVDVIASDASYLNAWIDYNADGDWDDAGEQVATDLTMAAGTNHVAFEIPMSAAPGTAYARLRLTSYDTGGALTPAGPATDGEVEDYALTIENDLYLYAGDATDDVISIKPGIAGTSMHEVSINGTVTTYDPAVYDAIYVDGLGGNDRAGLYGLDGSDDTFYGMAAASRMEVGTIFIGGADNVETVYGYAGTSATAGGDVAHLGGTAGDDTFVASDGSSYLAGGGYLHATRQFDAVEADVTGSGGTDKAYFDDTAGDDNYYGQATEAWIELSSGVVNRAVGFGQTRVTSSGSATAGDQAFLTGADGQDKFIARFDIGYMFGSGYLNSAAGFDYVEADVSGTTGEDWAYFVGTAGDDTYYGAVDESRMELSNGVVNKSIGFPNHYALAEGEATGDVAYLSGSAGDDVFVAGDGYAYTYGSGVLNSTRNFEAVEADVTADGHDSAALHGTAGVDRFYGGLSESRFELSTGVVNEALGAFDTVYAYGTSGDGDEAYLAGTAGDDTFVGRDGSAYIAGSGKVNSLRQFDYVEADVAGSGGTDAATFEDSAGDDDYYGQQAEAWMELGTGVENRAIGFASSRAVSAAGGTDDADFVGTTGDDAYYGAATTSRMELSNGVVNTATGFASYTAHAGDQVSGDSAYLSGSTGDDTFNAGNGYASVSGTGASNSANDFEIVELSVTADGYDRANLLDTAGVDIFYGGFDESRFELSTGVVNKVIGAFDIIYAFATATTGDEAYLSGSTGDDTFVGSDGSAYMANADKVNSVRNFDYVEADVTGSGGSDVATLHDSTLTDLFTADSDEASFDFGDDGDLEVLARGFARAQAFSTEGGPDKRDDDQAYNFILNYYGTEWE